MGARGVGDREGAAAGRARESARLGCGSRRREGGRGARLREEGWQRPRAAPSGKLKPEPGNCQAGGRLQREPWPLIVEPRERPECGRSEQNLGAGRRKEARLERKSSGDRESHLEGREEGERESARASELSQRRLCGGKRVEDFDTVSPGGGGGTGINS